MGFLDEIDSKVDKANSILDAVTGGGAGGAGGQSSGGTLEYALGETLDVEGSTKQIPVGKEAGGEKFNLKDQPADTYFIHFSFEHLDSSENFKHDKFSPETAENPPGGHAVMFRDALQREAIMLHGFVSSCAVAVKEATESQGALQDIANMAGNLLGGGGGAQPPDPSQLDSFLSEVKSVADTVKPISVEYPKINEAGKKFHETRNKYLGFCKSLEKFYLKPPPSNPAESAVTGAIANVPGVGKWINIILRYAMKMQNMYLAVYLQLRADHERNIEIAAHKLTTEAIKKNYEGYALTYPVWFKPQEKKQAANQNTGGGLLDKATGAVDSVKKEADKIKEDIYDFMGANSSPESTPGSGALSEIFGTLKAASKNTSDLNQPPSAADSINTALKAALQDIKTPPELVFTIAGKINDVNLRFLEEVYARIMAKGAEGSITEEMLVECGRRNFSNIVVDTAMDLILGLTGGKIPTGINVQGTNLDAKDLIKKQFYEKLSPYTEAIILYAAGNLAPQIEEVRKKANAEKAQTMEVFLGRLPWFTALMFRNTYFPIWNIVVEEVFGAISPELKKILKTTNETVNGLKDKVDSAAEKKRRAEAVKDKAMAEGLSAGLGGSNAGDYEKKWNEETEEGKKRREEREAQESRDESKANFFASKDINKDFPVSAREADGEGIKVEEELESVLPPTIVPENV